MKSLARIFVLCSATLVFSQIASAQSDDCDYQFVKSARQAPRQHGQSFRVGPAQPWRYRQDSRSMVRNRSVNDGRTYVPGGYRSSNGVYHSDN